MELHNFECTINKVNEIKSIIRILTGVTEIDWMDDEFRRMMMNFYDQLTKIEDELTSFLEVLMKEYNK